MEVDLIPLAQLSSRYGIARSNLYNRLKDLNLESVKQGRQAFITTSQLELLDSLHAHLETGGTTAEFLQKISVLSDLATTPTVELKIDSFDYREPTIILQPSALVSTIEAVVKKIIPNNRSQLNYLRELEEAYEKGWLLSTSELANLLGLNQKTITNYGQEFNDAGFIFTRVGTRKGGEIAWLIEKEDSYPNHLASSTQDIKTAFSKAFDPE